MGAEGWVHASCDSTMQHHGMGMRTMQSGTTYGVSPASLPLALPHYDPSQLVQYYYHQAPFTSTNDPINLLFMAWQKPNYT